MFYCTILPQKHADLGEFLFYGLMCDDMVDCQFAINEKLPCILNFFEACMIKESEGLMTVARMVLPIKAEASEWLSLKSYFSLLSLPLQPGYIIIPAIIHQPISINTKQSLEDNLIFSLRYFKKVEYKLLKSFLSKFFKNI